MTTIDSRASAGSFARGQRSDSGHVQTDGDFATGQRRAGVPRITGSFATGMRTLSRATTVGDFATGMRSIATPFIADDFLAEENVQLAA